VSVRTKPLVIIKIGGRPAADPRLLRLLIEQIAAQRDAYLFALVHGGGSEVSRISRLLGYEPRFVDGIRQTSEEEMSVIDMGLAGVMNAMILRMCLAAGLPAAGISGIDAGLFTGESVASPAEPPNRTGRVTEVRPTLLEYLLDGGYLPVISPVSSDEGGNGLNINADDAASALAAAVLPAKMLFVSDIPGVLDRPPGEPGSAVIAEINRRRADELIAAGTVSGGMIPKIGNALDLVEAGVGEVVIGDLAGGLDALLNRRAGTRIRR
jgi:acetylglutamate kinase